MTDVYIFDFGRVLIDFDMKYMTEIYVKDSFDAKTVEEVVFDRCYWDKLDEGTVTDEQVIKAIKSRLPERLHSEAQQVYENWYLNLNPIKGMYELVEDIKNSGKKIYLLSNISERFADNCKKVEHLKNILSLFDGLVFSGKIKLVKPNKDIFEYTINKYKLNPRDCTFIDDNENNIKTASQMGINTYLFDGDSQALRKYIGI